MKVLSKRKALTKVTLVAASRPGLRQLEPPSVSASAALRITSVVDALDGRLDSAVTRSRVWARLWLGLFRESGSAGTSDADAFVSAARLVSAQDPWRIAAPALDQLWREYRAAVHYSTAPLRNPNPNLRYAVATVLHTTPLVAPPQTAQDRLESIVRDLDRERVELTRADARAMARVYAHADCDLAITVALSRAASLGLIEALGWTYADRNCKTSVERLIWRWYCKYIHTHVIPHHILVEFFGMLAKVKSVEFALALYDTQKHALEFTSQHHPEIIAQLKFENNLPPVDSANLAPHERIRHNYTHLPVQVYKDLLYLLVQSKTTTVLIDSSVARRM
ncbi:UNVERIFIED_CONTAM: hypothetical protein HDU68_006087, partial [Siphonaria sp. JEL0065]